MLHVICRNNFDYPYKAILVKEEDILLSGLKPGLLVYYSQKKKKYMLAVDNKCDFSTGGIYMGRLEE